MKTLKEPGLLFWLDIVSNQSLSMASNLTKKPKIPKKSLQMIESYKNDDKLSMIKLSIFEINHIGYKVNLIHICDLIWF